MYSIQSKFSWDQYFMTMAYLVAMKSKDPSTKVGAVIVGPNKEIRSTGYNGLPRGLEDKTERYDRPMKYNILNHAEENAILHCSRIGVSAYDCTIYVPWFPCSLCAKSIIQSGITTIVYHSKWPGNHNKDSKWNASMEISKEMFNEVGIKIINFSENLIPIKGHYHEQEFTLF